MTFRRLTAAVLAVAAVGALAAGCSSDDDASGTSGKRSTTSTTIATPTTVNDADFQQAIQTSEALIKDAGSDACKLLQTFAQASNLPTPANPKQTEQGVQVVVDLFRSAASAQPAPPPADAEVLRQAADALVAEGKANGWDPKWLTTGAGPSSIKDPKVAAAFQNYQTEVAKTCVGPSSTTVP